MFVVIVISLPAYGQKSQYFKRYEITSKCVPLNEFEVGVESGPTITTLWGNHQLPYKMDYHYNTGLFFRYNFLCWLGIQGGVNLERLGPKSDIIWTDMSGNKIGDGYVKWQFDYLTFPLLFRFNAIDRRANLSFTLGGFASYLYQARQIQSPLPPGTPGDPNPGQESTMDITNAYKRFNTGLVFGTAFDYYFLFGLNIGFEVRDQLGLFHIPNNNPASGQELKTNSLQLLGRVSFKW